MWTFDSDTDPGYWVEVESPTNVTLRDLTTTANGPVAVGDKGVAIGRGQDRWGVILENGPGARSQTLHAVDATDDGERVWFAGAGGAFGYYDLRTEERRDYSVPRGNSNTFYSLAVAGDRGEEKFLVGDGSGHVLPGHVENQTETDWSWSTTPNSGNAVEALAHDADGYGYAVDVNSNVFMTTADDGWARVGVDDAQGSFYDCAFADGHGSEAPVSQTEADASVDGVFLTGGGNGMVFEATELVDHDDDATWTPTDLGGFGVYGIDAGHGGQLACGESGNVFIRKTGGEWARGKHDRTHTFRAGLVDEQMVVVGGGGLIVERRGPDEASDDVKSRYGDGEESDEGDTGHEDGADEEDEADEEDDGADGSAEEGDDGSTGEENADDVESDIEWEVAPEPPECSADGDQFDGRGENYDGDEAAPGESTGDSGNDESDPADEPDESDSDGGDSGNDEADDSGNDESDLPDEPDADTDSDADSPD